MLNIRTSALFTTQGAAIETGLSTRRINQLAGSGELPSITLLGPASRGAQRVYRAEDVRRLARRHRGSPHDETGRTIPGTSESMARRK